MVLARRWARRVLPTPPGPNSVRMRPVSSSRPRELEVALAADERGRLRRDRVPRRPRRDRGRRQRRGATQARSACSSRTAVSSVAERGRRFEPELVAQRRPELLRDRGAPRPGDPSGTAPASTGGRSVSRSGWSSWSASRRPTTLLVTTDAQLGVDLRFGGDEPELLQPHRLGTDPLGLGELGERVAPPLGQCGRRGRRARRPGRGPAAPGPRPARARSDRRRPRPPAPPARSRGPG